VIHFKWQVSQTVSLQIYISFSQVSSQVLPLLQCLYFYLVSCSPTMTVDTNIAFFFTLCLALLRWQQTQTLPLLLPFVLHSYNDSKPKHNIFLYLVSCSPTMTTNTNIAFTFTLCLALTQWQQTPTLHLPLPYVLLSYNDSKHQHCLYFYLVSCSPTMTANTNTAFTFTLCLALLQWQQTPTLPLLLPCVLLSNNDRQH